MDRQNDRQSDDDRTMNKTIEQQIKQWTDRDRLKDRMTADRQKMKKMDGWMGSAIFLFEISKI